MTGPAARGRLAARSPGTPHPLIARLLSSLLVAACGFPVLTQAAPIGWASVQAMPERTPGLRVPYGRAQQQFAELRLPPGAGPHPVLVLIHGGCWHKAYDLEYFSHLADALTRETGAATWNIEYRRLGDPGAGWPGTMLDVASATDHLRSIAELHHLDLGRVVSVGHSAGGQLALWLASRNRLEPGSAPYRPNPLPLIGVVGLAPIADLAAYANAPGGCNSAVSELLGGSPARQVARYQMSSPRARLPLGVPQWLIQGAEDPIVPTASVRAYAEAARASGDTVELTEIAGAGHFEAALPDTSAWPAVLKAVRAALSQP